MARWKVFQTELKQREYELLWKAVEKRGGQRLKVGGVKRFSCDSSQLDKVLYPRGAE